MENQTFLVPAIKYNCLYVNYMINLVRATSDFLIESQKLLSEGLPWDRRGQGY